MPDIEISAAAYRELERPAVAFNCGLGEVVDRLVTAGARLDTLRRKGEPQPMQTHEAFAEAQPTDTDVRP
jgi:hypothetical protein